MSEWHFNDSAIPWILPESYRDPSRPDPNSRPPLPMPVITRDPDIGDTIQIADIIDAAGIRPSDGQEEADDNEEKDGFVTVEETDRPAGDLVLVSISTADMDPATATGTPGGVCKLFESDEDESDAQLGEQVEALLAEGGPLEVPTVVDNEEEEGAQDDGHSSDDDEEDGDGDEANATRDYYADQDPPPEETLPEAPKQSSLLDLLAGKKPDDVLENLGTTQATNKTINNPATGKGKGPSSVTSGKAPDNPRVPGSTDTATTTLTPAAQGEMEHAQGTLFGAADLGHVPTGEEQVVRNLENNTGLLARLQQLVVTMVQGFQEASEDIRELISSTLEWAPSRTECLYSRHPEP